MPAEEKGSRRYGTMAAWLVPSAVIACAVVRVLTTPPPLPPDSPDERTAHRIFDAVAAAEPSWRARAAGNFPGDLWSQDDDFHAMEAQRAAQQAGTNRIAIGDVLRVIDEGMHAGWQRSASIQPTVAPCRPRPVY